MTLDVPENFLPPPQGTAARFVRIVEPIDCKAFVKRDKLTVLARPQPPIPVEHEMIIGIQFAGPLPKRPRPERAGLVNARGNVELLPRKSVGARDSSALFAREGEKHTAVNEPRLTHVAQGRCGAL